MSESKPFPNWYWSDRSEKEFLDTLNREQLKGCLASFPNRKEWGHMDEVYLKNYAIQQLRKKEKRNE